MNPMEDFEDTVVTKGPGLLGRMLRPVGRTALRICAGRLRPMWITAAIIMVTFTGFRLGLLLKRLDGLEGVGVEELLICFVLGLRYDIMPLGYLVIPMALLLTLSPSELFARGSFRRVVTVYATGAFALVLLMEICGAAFFLHFGLRINWMAIYYLRYPREVATYIAGVYPLWLLVIGMLIVTYVGYRIMWWLLWPRVKVSASSPVGRIIAAILLAAMCVLACRGGADQRPLRRGSAYISYNNLVNQLTLNNFFTFTSALKMKLTNNRKESGWYPFPPLTDMERVSEKMLLQPGRDSPLRLEHNSQWRLTRTDRPQRDYNVVIILMEGMSGREVGALGYGSPCTPQLDELCGQGVFFERMYAVGTRTSKGVMGVLCGHPDIGGGTILTRIEPTDDFLTLPGVLRGRGYETMFIYGGDPNFDNMKEFFGSRGIDRFVGQDDLGSDKAGAWGVPDELILDAAHEAFSKMGSRKFFSVILTVSNHEDYVVPQDRTPLEPVEYLSDDRSKEQASIRNAYRYADWALGEFFKKARQEDYFKRTIFVLVADHGVRLDKRKILDVSGFRIPCVIYAPGISQLTQPQSVQTVCSQADIAPTILSLLGGDYEHCFLGRDILSVPEGDGFAFLRADDRIGIIRGDEALVLPPLCEAILFRDTHWGMERVRTRHVDLQHVHNLKLEMLSYYGMARHLYQQSAYNGPRTLTTMPATQEQK